MSMTVKARIILFVIIVVMIAMIVGCVSWNSNSKRTIERTIETKRTIEIESNKESDTNQAIEPAKDEPIFYLTDYERWVVECVVMGESGGEPYEGQVLVAQCILNACLKDNIQPSEVRVNYKYSGWRESPSDSVKRAVSAVFDEGYKITDEFILYFYAPKLCNSKWHETQIFVIECGGHRFFKEDD